MGRRAVADGTSGLGLEELHISIKEPSIAIHHRLRILQATNFDWAVIAGSFRCHVKSTAT